MNPPQQSRVDKTMKLYRNKTIVRIVNTKMATKNAVRETNNQCLKVNFRKQYLKVKIHERKCSYHVLRMRKGEWISCIEAHRGAYIEST